jgi:alanyl-tRNA synthetase
MTDKLYYRDAYKSESSARIVTTDGDRLVLDRTVFYPKGGGQLGDTGSIAGRRVRDTQVDSQSDTIVHLMEESVSDLTPGAEVEILIDWDRRYSLMRHHTLLHLVHEAFASLYGDHRIRGSEVRPDKARVDYEYFDDVDGDAIAERVAAIVREDKAVATRPRNLSDNTSEREWVVEGLRTIPCGGTHVARTGEIGDFTVQAKRKGKQGVRLYCSVASST